MKSCCAILLFLNVVITFDTSEGQSFQAGWATVFENNEQVKTAAGNKASIVDAVQRGADVNISIDTQNTALFAPCDWTYARAGQVACLNTQHISIKNSEAGLSFGFQNDPYHWFIIVNTSGQRDVRRWNVGEHKSRGQMKDNVGIRWWIRSN